MRLKRRDDFDKADLTDQTISGSLENIKALVEKLINNHDLKNKDKQEEVFGIFDEIEYEVARVAVYLNSHKKGWWFI